MRTRGAIVARLSGVSTPQPHDGPTEFSCVLWDVDGTIVDASEGILRRLRHTITELGHRPPTAEELHLWIGPPLFDSFRRQLGMTEEQATAALVRYRLLNAQEGFAAGARLFPGVLPVIAAVHAAGLPQATASSKPEDQVLPLMAEFGVAGYLTATVGAGKDERARGSKEQVVREALRRLDEAGVDTSRPVLVGDRHHDVEGAAAVGVPTIFVSWGFSEPWESDGALDVVDTPAALQRRLLDRRATP